MPRLTDDSLKVGFPRGGSFFSRIYVTVVWFVIVVGSYIVLTGVEPIYLLVITSAGGGVVMAFYSVLLIVLNRRALPGRIRLRGFRLAAIMFSSVVFMVFTAFLVYQAITQGPASLA